MKSSCAQAAIEAQSNVNVLGAIVAILEGNLLFEDEGSSMQKAVRDLLHLCNLEISRQVNALDKATGRTK